MTQPLDQDHDDIEDLRAKLTQTMFRKAVLDKMDALVAFVPEGQDTPSKVKEMIDEMGESREYPVPGGWHVKCPYVDQEFDAEVFTIEKDGWDHVHCDICSGTIGADDVCWASDREDGHIICGSCFAKLQTGTNT